MSFDVMESDRTSAQWDILKRFGERFEKTEKSLTERFTDPAMRRLAAARAALEYAVIQTATEKAMPTEIVAQALQNASRHHQAMMVNEGRVAMGRAYGVEPDVLVSAFAGKVVEVPMPRGFGTTPEFDKMIDAARNAVTAIVQQSYATRGHFENSRNASYVALQSDAATGQTRSELAARLAFMESAIDTSVSKGGLTTAGAELLKERIEAQIFQPRPPQSANFNQVFKAYFEFSGARMRIDVMKEVRAVTQSLTVQQIGEKVNQITMMLTPEKAIKVLER